VLALGAAISVPAAAGVGDPRPAEAPADDDLLALQQTSLALDDGLEDPFADESPLAGLGLDPSDLDDDVDVDDLDVDDLDVDDLDIGELEAGEPTIEAAPEIPALDGLGELESGPDLGDLGDLGALAQEAPGAPPAISSLDDLANLEVADLDAGNLDDDMLGDLDAPLPAGGAPVVAADAGASLDALEEGGPARISQLLDEGQVQFERGEYQEAIDAWSRIFLIDIDNGEASRRIEEARNKKAELERQAEEIFYEAIDQIEQKALDEAQESLRRVLEIKPGHTMADEYLRQLEAGQVPTVVARSTEGEDLDISADEFGGEGGASTAPGKSLEAAVQRDRVVVIKRTDWRLVALGGVAALVVIGGGIFLALKWNTLFPNAEAPPPAQTQIDMIERATRIHDSGAVENAILLLQKIQPEHPSYADAQALLAQWNAEVTSVETETEETGPSEEVLARRDLLVRAAREAHEQRQFIRARRYLDRASKILPLTEEDQAMKQECDQQLGPLEDEIGRFDQGEYSEILPNLWRKRDIDPTNKDVILLIVDSYYNLALRDLQRNDPTAAADKLRDALEVDPGNRDLERMRLFAMTYSRQPPDLLYRIYVKYLPSR